jgi:flagellar M-ring protein FliF
MAENVPSLLTPATPDRRAFALPESGRFNMLRDLFQQPAVRRAAPALAGIAALTMVGATYLILREPAQAPLYAGLAETDKAAISEALQTAGIGFSIDPATGALTVDANRVHEARIALAGQGLPKAQPIGGSALSELPMGASRAVEGETLRSAREHELSRTIETIDSVATAKVHIGAPDPSPFVRSKSSTTASVMLTLEGGRSLSDGQVQAIRFLVASSVPDLQVDQVSVIDQRGNLLSETANDGDLKLLQIQGRIEDRLRAALERLFMPVVGSGNFSVEVNADIDLSESQATRETYPQDDRALRSEQVNRSTTLDSAAPAVGVPGALSNQPPEQAALAATPPAAGATPTTAARQNNENSARAYEVGREISVTHQPQGRVRRISVAVALNQGTKAFTPADLAKFEALAKGAVGFDAARGDTIAVSQRPFVAVKEEAAPFWLQSWFMPLVQQLAAALIALLAFLFIGRPLIAGVKARSAARAETETLINDELTMMESESKARDLSAAGGEVTLDMIESAPSYETRANLVRNFVRQDPRRAAMIVRRMLREDQNGRV